ncbi:MAG: hypothetical protein Q8L64_06130 [bacterium]|nr:hypothetical protein [bacterium]
MKRILLILGILILLIGGFIIASKDSDDTKATLGIYCSSDGTLSDMMPIQSHRSYCIKSDSNGKTYALNAPNSYSFLIVDDQGNTLKDYAITHTKPMHVIAVRKDLAYFQHIHPEFDKATGTFTLADLAFPEDGEYRIFADFAPEKGQMGPMGEPLVVTISDDVNVGSDRGYASRPLGSEERTKVVDGYQINLAKEETLQSGEESRLAFNISQNGKPVTDMEEYLGALGHTVVLKEGTLDFIHAHPVEDVDVKQTGAVNFLVSFPEAGKYKVFSQFQRGGKVFTSDFVVSVVQGVQPSTPEEADENVRSMKH